MNHACGRCLHPYASHKVIRRGATNRNSGGCSIGPCRCASYRKTAAAIHPNELDYLTLEERRNHDLCERCRRNDHAHHDSARVAECLVIVDREPADHPCLCPINRERTAWPVTYTEYAPPEDLSIEELAVIAEAAIAVEDAP